MDALQDICEKIPLIFPVHPRTRRKLMDMQYTICNTQLRVVEPLGYLDFLALQREAAFVITDSGGIQEETTYLGVPCLTLRENTERPVTVTRGTNKLVGQDMALLRKEIDNILQGMAKQGSIPPLWDARAGDRIAEVILATC